MNLNQQSSTIDNNAGQSIGCDPKSRRNSGLFSFFKWFKPSSSSRESIDAIDLQKSRSNSCDSLNSTHSAGTVASFSFVPPSAYKKCVSEKCIAPGPETDTYKARIKQRDKRRECDKNLTLRKKYNLFFNKDTLLKPKTAEVDEENTKSLPLMTRPTMETEQDARVHRRTNSESSKLKKAGAYLHVKGKRRAPQPPGLNGTSTASLRRKKRVAPAPPVVKAEVIADILCNDSLKLDHGILKSAKETETKAKNSQVIASNSATSTRSSYVEAPVSPRPWYKRNTVCSKKEKTDNKYEPIEVPEVPYKRNSTLDLTSEEVKVEKKKEEKRKSGLSFLTNISELDREASEIIKNKELEKNGFADIPEMPEFMRPKETKINTDSWVSPKRRSAKDLIAKFNAITNVTKVTVFGASPRDARLFGKQTSLDETKQRQQALLESHKKKIEEIDKKNLPLMKSESASAIKVKPETPKMEKKSWRCPKCNLENEYWRIICHVCSAIKPYFDDFSSSKIEVKHDLKTSSPLAIKRDSPPKKPELNLERSKTQIGFSALANYNATNKTKLFEKTAPSEEKSQKDVDSKKEEKEKLKKMLIEMKNSLPKRKSNVMLKQNNRASVIVENPEHLEEVKQPEVNAETEEFVQKPEEEEKTEEPSTPEKSQEEKVAEILIGTTQTIYENIKIKKTDNPKPVKVSSSAQTSGVVKQVVPPSTVTKLLGEPPKRSNGYEQYELMRPKDFEDIYTDSNSKSAAKIYANLARNDELSLFFNMPKNVDDVKNEAKSVNNTDTIEINRLLKRLEIAIAKGELVEAAIFAKELAQLKVNCSVIRQKPSLPKTTGKRKGIQIEMYVEDKVSHRGPFPIEVVPEQTVADLKKQVEREFEIPLEYQRWILGKELVVDDSSTLKHHGITSEGCPVFLYLVAPDPQKKVGKTKTPTDKEAPSTSNIQNVTKETSLKEEEQQQQKRRQSVIAKITPENEFEKVKSNVQNLQNILRESKGKEPLIQTSKTVDHSPKIVNVIPKTSENKSKQEVRIIPIQIEKAEPKSILKPVPTITVKEVITIEEKPVAITEIKSEQTPVKILTSQEVIPRIQYVFPTIQNSYQNNLVKEKSESPSTKETQLQKEEPYTSQKFENQVNKVQAGSSQSSKPTKEEDEEYDSKTLKPAKEWECHLCTLLNPVTSNVCAVCATVRIRKEAQKRHIKKKAPQPNVTEAKPKNDQTYLQLMDLDNADLVENVEPFECVICFLEIPEQEGVTLRECLHQFCKACLAHTIEFNDEAEVKCPYRDEVYSCNIALQDREIKALVTTVVYEQHLAKSVTQAENKIDKSFHCKTPDCKGWCIFEDNVNEFRCPVCRRNNCLTCQAIHMGMNCKEYQEKMSDESSVDDDARRTRDMLEEMVKNGEAIECPTCKVILMKKWGCDWLRCSMCKTEICWVTRGPRWGPGGKGDISGGCQCGLNGIKCHPKCNYCH